jgi:Ni,Fe-hydrogenase I cytochrome b subunit
MQTIFLQYVDPEFEKNAGFFRLLHQAVRFVCVSVLLLRNYFASADVRTHVLADHINNRPFSITVKKKSDHDDG